MRVRRFNVGKLVNKLKILIAVLLLYIYQYYNFAELIRFPATGRVDYRWL